MGKELEKLAEERWKRINSLTREEIEEAVRITRLEIAHDLEEAKAKYPPADGETLTLVITE